MAKKMIEVVRFVFGDIPEDQAELIISSCTGWPCFFPRGNPVKHFFYQLWHAKRSLDKRVTIDQIFEGTDQCK